MCMFCGGYISTSNCGDQCETLVRHLYLDMDRTLLTRKLCRYYPMQVCTKFWGKQSRNIQTKLQVYKYVVLTERHRHGHYGKHTIITLGWLGKVTNIMWQNKIATLKS